ADVKSLVYLDKVISEGLRLRPSAWAVGREVVAPFERGGVRFEQGAQLMCSQWAMHRDPRFYRNPEAFVPERWTPAFKRSLPRGASSPSGDGPRVCIGTHSAPLDTALILGPILPRGELELPPAARLDFAPSVTLRARAGVSMRVRAARPLGSA